ncbi:MAG: arginase [Anaerolineae bacterium]
MNINLIGVPLDFGAGRRGVDMGPSAIRYAGLAEQLTGLGHTVHDTGNTHVPVMETCQWEDPKLRYLNCILAVARRLADRVASTLRQGHFPLVLGGDHSLSLGSVRGAASEKKIGLIWVDAHGDFNTTETTPSGNIHGMPLAALAGLGDARLVTLGRKARITVDPMHIAVVGARDLDPGEKTLLRDSGVAVFATEQIDRLGMYQVLCRAIDVASRGTEGIYLSFDLDAIDPVYAPGVGTAVDGGLTYREAHMVCEMVAETGRLVGMDLVEVNPILDERNRTARMAVELALSALGKRVWEQGQNN